MWNVVLQSHIAGYVNILQIFNPVIKQFLSIILLIERVLSFEKHHVHHDPYSSYVDFKIIDVLFD